MKSSILDISPTAQAILDRWDKQPNKALKTMTADELINCTENDIFIIKLVTELKDRSFISEVAGTGKSFCSANVRHMTNQVLEYVYGKGEESHV